MQPPSCLTRYSVVARSTECERGAGGGAHGVREMVGVWVCGELERACRVCGAQGGGRPCSSAVGHQFASRHAEACLDAGERTFRSTRVRTPYKPLLVPDVFIRAVDRVSDCFDCMFTVIQ